MAGKDSESGRDRAGGEASAGDAAQNAIDGAARAAETIARETGTSAGQPLDLPDLGAPGGAAAGDPLALGLLDDVTLRVKIELGRTQMYVEDILRLNANSVVELDKAAGDPVDIFVNDRHVARGEVLVLNDNFCVRVSEILRPIGSDDG